MGNILKVNSVSDYSAYHGLTDRHRLISVIDFDEISPIRNSLNQYGVYGLFMHKSLSIELTYGCGKYDYTNGTLICVAPGQIGGKEDDGSRIDLDGWGLLFHPDLLHGTLLEKRIKDYSFFDYRINEALHMTENEYDIFASFMRQIKGELENKHDDVQDSIIVGYIELMLNFCRRFYNRQFITRKLENSDILAKFETLLHEYFKNGSQVACGLPSMQYFSDRLYLSSNYLGDLIKKTTGNTATFHIRKFVMQEAKNNLASGMTISETAYALGFDFPQHLSRMFKKYEGISPSQYITSIRKGCTHQNNVD